ncbi:MAG: DUF5680 domain-containing protein [Candidatus Magasanikbacteria bacterium]
MPNKHWKNIEYLSLHNDKTKGYGSNPKKYLDPFLPRFKVIHYKKGKYQIVDRYTGQEQNIGQAIYYYHRQPVYGVNYYGIVVRKKPKAEVIFDFLKEALRAGSGKSIHRGLDGYKNSYWLYKNKFSERRGFVEGEEKIFYKGKLVYIQVYHGGLITDLRSYQDWSKKLLSSVILKKETKL